MVANLDNLALTSWYILEYFGFLLVRVHGFGYDAFHMGLLVSVPTVSYLLIQPVAGCLADRFDPVITLRTGMLLACIATAAINLDASLQVLVSVQFGQTLMLWLVTWRLRIRWEQQWAWPVLSTSWAI